jgi:predicted Rossmann-fold nucleotide-binding protein
MANKKIIYGGGREGIMGALADVALNEGGGRNWRSAGFYGSAQLGPFGTN